MASAAATLAVAGAAPRLANPCGISGEAAELLAVLAHDPGGRF
jgi:hypothetical protein